MTTHPFPPLPSRQFPPMPDALRRKAERLRHGLQELDGALVAFSGGIDSTLVLKVASDVLRARAVAVTAVSPTFPQEEFKAVRRLSDEIGVRLIVASTNQLRHDEFARNDAARCYHCKRDLYRLFDPIKQDTGIAAVVDGTHVDDLGDDRPGIEAARAFGVRSPLVEAGFGKTEIRALAGALGLSNWDKPAAACLSSRIPRGTRITEHALRRVEQAERALAQEGFGQVRVRTHGDVARIEVPPTDLPRALDPDRRERIARELRALGFQFVTLDLEGYRRGGAEAG